MAPREPLTEAEVAADRLRRIVAEIERSDDRIASENRHKSDIFKNAKKGGFNVKALRKVIAARRMDAIDRAALDNDFDLYMMHLEGAAHAHVEIIDEFPDHDAETGEIIEPGNGAGTATADQAPQVTPAVATSSAEPVPSGNSERQPDPKPVGMAAADIQEMGDEGANATDDAQNRPAAADQSTAARKDEHDRKMGAEGTAVPEVEATASPETLGHASPAPAGTQAPPVDTQSPSGVVAADAGGGIASSPAPSKLKMNAEFFAEAHPLCKNPDGTDGCGGNSNLGLCIKCRAAAGIVGSHDGQPPQPEASFH